MCVNYFKMKMLNKTISILYVCQLLPDEDACLEEPCKNNGTCTPDQADFNCSCQKAFSGSTYTEGRPNKPEVSWLNGSDLKTLSGLVERKKETKKIKCRPGKEKVG